MNAAAMAERAGRTSSPPPLKCAELDVPRFTAHNIRLDDGTLTKPEAGETIDRHPWFLAAKRIPDATCQGPRNKIRLLDLGCLEGGYSVEFARLGYRTVGLDVRDANIATCRYVQSRVEVKALEFVQDDAWNVAQYREFDATFCCGLLYHLDKPLEFQKSVALIKALALALGVPADPIRNRVHGSVEPLAHFSAHNPWRNRDTRPAYFSRATPAWF
jgi:SAM-dependent methyltransferase